MVAAHLLLMNHFFMSLTHNSPEVGAFSDFNSVIVDVGCPIGCTQCSPINGCLACKPPFFLLLHREGTRQTASCTTTCPSGFYKLKKKRNGFCTKCTMRGCTECLAVHYCSVCDPEFVNFFGKCIKQPTDEELEDLGVFVTRPPYTSTTTATTTTATRPSETPRFTSNDSTSATTSTTPLPFVLDTLSPSATPNTTATTTSPARTVSAGTTASTRSTGGNTGTLPSIPVPPTPAPPSPVTPGTEQPTRYDSDRERCRRKYTRKKGRRRGGRARNGRRKNGRGQKGRRRGHKRRRNRKKNGGRGRKERKKNRNNQRHQRRRCRRRKKSGRRRTGVSEAAKGPSERPVDRGSKSAPPNTTALGEPIAGSRTKHELENQDVHRVREIKLSLLEEETQHHRRRQKERRTRRLKSKTFFYKNRPLAMVEYKQSRAYKQAKPLRVNGRRVRHGRRSDQTREA